MTRSHTRSAAPAFTLGAIVLAVLALVGWTWGLNILHLFTTTWREGAVFWTPLVVGALIALAVVLRGSSDNSMIAAIAILVLGGLVGVGMAIPANYFRLNAYYSQSATVGVAANEDYAERVPFEVASETSSNVLGDITGEVVPVKSLATSGDDGGSVGKFVCEGFGVIGSASVVREDESRHEH